MRRVARIIVIAIVLVAWAIYLARSWDRLQSYPWQIAMLPLALALAAAMVYWLSLAVAWHRSLRVMHGTLLLVDAITIWLRSMLMRYVPGNIWHVMGRVYLAERHGQSRRTILASTIVEQILTLVGGSVAFALSLPLWMSVGRGWLLLMAIIPAGLLALHPSLLDRGLVLGARVLRRPMEPMTVSYGDQLRLLPWYVAPNVFGGINLALCLASVGPVSLGQLPALMGAFAAAWVVGYLSVLTPSGIGVREGALTLMLTPTFGLAPAMVASLLSRLSCTVAELLLVLLWQVITSSVGRRRFVQSLER
ncbi:MAG: hypothetical protein EPO21_02610 [Chloroflexota bacterium]|nr:MAG: hypothetical protein EPO21_02610 [Chloroflexota bacterium]